MRVSPDGTLALIANRTEGTVSVFSVKDKRLTAVGKVDTGNPKSLPSAVAFVDDKTALLTRGGDNMVSVLHIDGTNVTIDPRPITTGIAPYTMDINAAHTLAAVSNMGRGDGDAGFCQPDRPEVEAVPHRRHLWRPQRAGAAEVLARWPLPGGRRAERQHQAGVASVPPR